MDQVSKAERSPKTFLIAVCLLAFVLRIALMFGASTYRVVEDDTNHFGFGWEMGRVAASLAEGHGFSSPLPLPTGPTAIVGPAYPLLLALIFKLFGIYSTASSIAIRVLQCMFASLTCLFIYLYGRDSLEERTGKLAAIAWAVFPLNIFFTVDKVWETTVTAMLTAALSWLLLKMSRSLSLRRWIGTAALVAAAGLISTSLVMLVIPFGLSAIARFRLRVLRPTVAAILTCLVVVSPWLVRNHMQFGKFVLRSNFPLEFRVGNNLLSYGQKVESLHPSNTPSVNVHWQQVGEWRFMEEERAANSSFIADHPGRFAFGTLNRIVNYWTGAWIKTIPGFPNSWPVILATTGLSLIGFLGIGLMIRKHTGAGAMYAGCLFLYPIVYYLTTSQPRFYHAMTPLLILSGAYWVLQYKDRLFPLKAFEADQPIHRFGIRAADSEVVAGKR